MIKSGCRLTFSFPLNYFHGLYLPIKLSTLLIIPHKMTFPAYIPDVYSLFSQASYLHVSEDPCSV